MKNANDLLDDMPVWNAFLRLAVPSVAAQLINILYNFISFVSKMFISRRWHFKMPLLYNMM